MRTIKKSNHVLQKFYPDFKKCLGYILRRDFHLHPISCQKSSLGYVTLLHLILQKHPNQLNCRHFPLMTGKCSQWKWKPIFLTAWWIQCHNKWSICLWKKKVSYKRLSWVEVLTKTFTLWGNPLETEKRGCVKVTLKVVVSKFCPIRLYHFFNFIRFVHTDHANFDFDWCSIFKEYCF